MLVAVASLGTNFIWTAGGPDADWDTAGNWFKVTSPPEWPNNNASDAVIPWDGSNTWQVDLVDVTVNTVTIKGNVDFGEAPGSSDPELSVGGSGPSITIDAVSGDVEVTISGGASLYVNVP